MREPHPSPALQARRRRVSHIRRRMVGVATATFLATAGGIAIQLVSGHDPALAHSSASKVASAGGSGSSSGTGSSSGSATTSGASTSGLATAVTTSAS